MVDKYAMILTCPLRLSRTSSVFWTDNFVKTSFSDRPNFPHRIFNHDFSGVITRLKSGLYPGYGDRVPKIHISRNSSQKIWVSLGVLFKGFWCPNDAQTPCWLRLWLKCRFPILKQKVSNAVGMGS